MKQFVLNPGGAGGLLVAERPPAADQGQREHDQAPKPAPRCVCGSAELVEVQIHKGQSARLDCRRCRRFVAFSVWYGRRLIELPNPGP
jgi:hypothetical protein